MNPFFYQARPERVVDGDTVVFRIDMGFHLECLQTVRLLEVDTPEMRSSSPGVRILAKRAKGFTQDWLAFDAPGTWPFILETQKGDHFGRWLGRVWRRDAPYAPDLSTALRVEMSKEDWA